MRIIAGEFRGRRLKSPDNYDIRPTSDKVKEAVFSMIAPQITGSSVAMDVFAGSGSMGLEAISRGVARVYFSDNNKDSLRLVKENVRLCGAEDRSILLSGDFRENVRRIREKVDFFFIDPPYADGFVLPAADAIIDAGILAADGLLICEHEKFDPMPDEYRGLKTVRSRRYGRTCITIYAFSEEEE